MNNQGAELTAPSFCLLPEANMLNLSDFLFDFSWSLY